MCETDVIGVTGKQNRINVQISKQQPNPRDTGLYTDIRVGIAQSEKKYPTKSIKVGTMKVCDLKICINKHRSELRDTEWLGDYRG